MSTFEYGTHRFGREKRGPLILSQVWPPSNGADCGLEQGEMTLRMVVKRKKLAYRLDSLAPIDRHGGGRPTTHTVQKRTVRPTARLPHFSPNNGLYATSFAT